MNILNSPNAAPVIDANGICSRCLFQNDCLRIRLLGLDGPGDVSTCFRDCRGMLTVSFGEITVECGGVTRVLREGDSCPLPDANNAANNAPATRFHLRPHQHADVLLFEKLRASQ